MLLEGEFTVQRTQNNRQSQSAPSMPMHHGGVTAYFDLDGTLLDASSEKKPNRHACETKAMENSNRNHDVDSGFYW